MKTIEETILIINNRIDYTYNKSLAFFKLSENEQDEEIKKTFEDISREYYQNYLELEILLEAIKN